MAQMGTPCPAECGELVSPLGSRVREAGRDWHVHCYLQPRLAEAMEAGRAQAREVAGKQMEELRAKWQAAFDAKMQETEKKVYRGELPLKESVPINVVLPVKEGLQELLDRSAERARDPVLYDVVSLGDSHPVRLGAEPAGHSTPRLLTYADGAWVESDHGEVLTCSCGSPQCRMIGELGLPRMVWSRQVAKLDDQDQRDELVRRLRR